MRISYKIIGGHIRAAREALDMTQEEVAERVGLSLVHYGNIERGARSISLDNLCKLCLTLRRPLEYFIAGALVEIPMPLEANGDRPHIARINAMLAGCSDSMLDMLAEVVESITGFEKERT